MKAIFRRRWIVSLAVLAAILGVVACGWWLGSRPARPRAAFEFHRVSTTNLHNPVLGNVTPDRSPVPDDLRGKYASVQRGEFHLVSSEDTAILVLATGVQVLTSSGWKTQTEDYRGEIWRLKAGQPKEVCVERPGNTTWRAFLRYGFEMHGVPVLKAQVREAWVLKSFSNWTGQAWGGGRFHGNEELFSEEIEE